APQLGVVVVVDNSPANPAEELSTTTTAHIQFEEIRWKRNIQGEFNGVFLGSRLRNPPCPPFGKGGNRRADSITR
ncbi:MAG: hypothetical protein PHD37_09845, partial [Gallionellaceae bacterium]|nr:hypothetical protein [Gallionellaceae bacterium]